MTRTAEALLEQADAYVRLADDALRFVSDQALLERLSAVARLRRLAQAEETAVAGEVARRSENRDDSLARKQGASNAANLVSQVTGMPRSTAACVVASGEALRPREAMSGEVLPATCPQIAEAFAAGLLDPEIAAAMRRTLADCAPGLAPWELDDLERSLLDTAAEGWAPNDLLRWLKRVPEHANPDGGRPDRGEPTPIPTVKRRHLRNGLVRWTLDLDTLTDGFLKTAVEANSPTRRPILVTPDQDGADLATTDRRPVEQQWVDGIRLIAKKAIQVDDGQIAGTAVTLLVTMTEEALRTGLGTAELPDCGTQISASVARMLAADAEIIPVVLGGKSQPLDLGTGRRFFTEAQRRAMAVRDGGCAGPGCDAPPSWCDGAHIRPAGRGPTSIDNGVLLCWRCHLLHDEQGWQIDRDDDGRWWWTPPPWIDPTGRRRPGGRIPPVAA
ncbi:HNH endonuclease signature motif containing protein [Amnibacterium kyonggiense]|uniref:5-methylcytosine-specific restriction protein A n=1 Tax=Amnibacterium kyonggiense TaxID=595671 RepID=A0A4R7FQ10_9MICO|nr:HNH endonuclease signature motif containing protein [Amnibacterium kyonggiense]TDS79851.1 5-methylcytosine-specific restriction protein A [Amnibacterium kyonggiense]